MSAKPTDHGRFGHPVVEFARAVSDRLDKLTHAPVWSMTPDQQREVLRELARAEAQLSGLRLRVLAEADRTGAGSERGAATVADWVAIETRQTRISARSDLKFARALEQRPHLAAALDSGAANVEQARVIVQALDRLPDRGEFAVSPDQRDQAEAHLVAEARHHDAKTLAVLGRRLFEVIAPELAEAFEGKVLAEQEAAAARRTYLSMREDSEGTVHGRFRIPTLHGTVAAQDDPRAVLTHPLHPNVRLHTSRHRRAPPDRGAARAGVVPAHRSGPREITAQGRRLRRHHRGHHDPRPAAHRPEHSRGVRPRHRRPAHRRPSTTPGLHLRDHPRRPGWEVPGPRPRPTTPSAHRSTTTRHEHQDRGCTAEHCQTPPAMCHAHHDTPWAHGGHTDLATGRLLCGHHHRRIHDPHYRTEHLPNGTIAFHRRT